MPLASLLLAASSADTNLSIFSPAAAPATEIRDLFYMVTAITGVIFLLVGGMLVYCIIRFRRAPGDVNEPPQIYGSQPIEVAWTLAPLLTVFILFLVIVRSVGEVRHTLPPDDSLPVIVRGHQWWWEYEYPTLGVKTANELHVPVNMPVALQLESVDVVHSFWVPRLSGKTDVVPGQVNTMWFRPYIEGIFQGNCAEYCGTEHANMLLRISVESAGEFQDWIDDQKKDAREDSDARAGRGVFLKLGCINCHTIRGTGAGGTFGPDLTHLGSRQTLASAMVPNDPEYLTQWLNDPQAIKPGCWMPSFHLTDKEVKELVKYLHSLK